MVYNVGSTNEIDIWNIRIDQKIFRIILNVYQF